MSLSSIKLSSFFSTRSICHLFNNTTQTTKFFHSTPRKGVIGILKEESYLWERRAPLTPIQVGQLVREGHRVLIQPSGKRVFPQYEYERSGATFSEDLTEADLILGVKQVLVDKIIPGKTYALFSHTIKAQPSNMPLLDACIRQNVRLIDYEMIVDQSGNRMVAFSREAGICGMINIIYGLGIRLLALGHHTPLVHVGLAHNYPLLPQALAAVSQLGPYISSGAIPPSLSPLIFCFTGDGNVSKGAQSVFKLLPHEFVSPNDLKEVVENGDPNRLYGTIVNAGHHLRHKDSGDFGIQHYLQNQSQYTSNFNKTIAPYITCLVNGVFWASGCPRLLTEQDFVAIQKERGRLIAIADISNDYEGSIEISRTLTTLDKPFAIYDACKKEFHDNLERVGMLISNIDNLPTQLPIEATSHFGESLMYHIPDMLRVSKVDSLDDPSLALPIRSAVITFDRQLAKNYSYITKLRNI